MIRINKICFCLLAFLLLSHVVLAVDFDKISNEDKETFDEILKPVMKIYSLVKYIASAIAVIFLLFSGERVISKSSRLLRVWGEPQIAQASLPRRSRMKRIYW